MQNRQPMEHPPRARHNLAVLNLREGLERKFNSDWNKRLKDQLTFFDNGEQIFADVWVGSGFMRRTKSDSLLDWALLMPRDKSRIGANALPDEETWALIHRLKYLPQTPKGGTSLQAPPSEDAPSKGRPLRKLQHGDHVYKVGATSGPTAGLFNGLRTVCYTEAKYMTPKRPPSLELSFIGVEAYNRPKDIIFAASGDSGAVVFDETGRAVGLLFSGQTPQQCRDNIGHALVTPIEDVLEDIKQFSKGQITDIRIAKS